MAALYGRQGALSGPAETTELHQPTTAVLLGNLPSVTRIRYVSTGDPGAGPTPSSFRATVDLAG